MEIISRLLKERDEMTPWDSFPKYLSELCKIFEITFTIFSHRENGWALAIERKVRETSEELPQDFVSCLMSVSFGETS